MTTQDAEIHAVALPYIRRQCMRIEEWKHTSLGSLLASLRTTINLEHDELVLVSGHTSADNWYVFTTRRIRACYRGTIAELDPRQNFEENFGNFKGYEDRLAGSNPTEVATLTSEGGNEQVRFEFETLYASMAPIYACKFWQNRKGITWRHLQQKERSS